jgi:adenylate kinase
MEAKTLIFIGPQGSGKGTQVELLKKKLNQIDGEHFITHIETGKPFRELAAAGGYTADVVKNLINNGKFVPNVITNAFVVDEFVKEHVQGAHIILDGYPRNREQAEVCDELFQFYGRHNVEVIHLDTAKEVVVERMLARGREDDTETAIEERLAQYERVTKPLLTYYNEQSNAIVHDIDGGQTIEAVQAKLCQVLNLK